MKKPLKVKKGKPQKSTKMMSPKMAAMRDSKKNAVPMKGY